MAVSPKPKLWWWQSHDCPGISGWFGFQHSAATSERRGRGDLVLWTRLSTWSTIMGQSRLPFNWQQFILRSEFQHWKVLSPEKVCVGQKILVQKIFLVPKYFWSQNILSPKIYEVSNYFESKKIVNTFQSKKFWALLLLYNGPKRNRGTMGDQIGPWIASHDYGAPYRTLRGP